MTAFHWIGCSKCLFHVILLVYVQYLVLCYFCVKNKMKTVDLRTDHLPQFHG